MRRILAASLLLSPLFVPAAALASPPALDASAATQSRSVSTGATQPSLIRTSSVILSSGIAGTFRDDSTVVLHLNVDEQGKPNDIQVINSVSPTLDANVVDAVRKFRWKPATLDMQPVATDMKLSVTVKK